MVQFFGILSPDFGAPRDAAEAPRKVGFFGAGGVETGAVRLSRAEQDACFLTERGPEPAERDDQPRPRFVRFHIPCSG